MSRGNGKAPERARRSFSERFGAGALASEVPGAEEPGAGALASEVPSGGVVLASAPGRVELAGNHTDHQGGRTISAAVDRRTAAVGRLNGGGEMRLHMEGFGDACVKVCELEPRARERGSSVSLLRGMAAAHARAGGALRGFDATVCSDLPPGCGMSSSAAFEMLLGVLIWALCGPAGKPGGAAVRVAPGARRDERDLVALALDGSWAEGRYFGKPSGAQDQLASAFGGVVSLSFSDARPRVEPLAFDLRKSGYAAFLVDSRCDHSAYPEDFAAIPSDMRAVARLFGRGRLEDVPFPAFLGRLRQVRAQLGDRAALRALHYFEETRRVGAQEQALKRGDFERFLSCARLSGASSAQFLQNVSPRSDEQGGAQSALVILALCAHLLGEQGAARIHGGGFGGSVLAFVPEDEAGSFASAMEGFLGYDACMGVTISPSGAQAEELGR